MSLKNKKVLVGLTGGIACYKVPYLVRALHKAEADIRVVMTDAATKFITPLTLETVSRNPVAVEMFPKDKFISTRHIDLAEWAELIVIAPATANFMGKVASGISDDLLTTIVCAAHNQVMIAPAMNPTMWLNKITQRNYHLLKDLGYMFIEPNEGEMACEHQGVGRMAEPDELFDAVKKYFAGSDKKSSSPKKKSLKNKKILITAGPTRELIDPVRYISNYSSGKMGYALAEAARDLGAEVTLVSGPTSLDAPLGVEFIGITSTDELFKEVSAQYKKHDCLIMAAAPADFKPEQQINRKIKKSEKLSSIELHPTVDILSELSKKRKGKNPLLVGFALETENGLQNARRKLKEKQLDMIVLNQPTLSTGFEHDTNKITIIMPGKKPVELPFAKKIDLSYMLLDKIGDML